MEKCNCLSGGLDFSFMSLGTDGVERAWGDLKVKGNSLVREPSFVGVGLYDAVSPVSKRRFTQVPVAPCNYPSIAKP